MAKAVNRRADVDLGKDLHALANRIASNAQQVLAQQFAEHGAVLFENIGETGWSLASHHLQCCINDGLMEAVALMSSHPEFHVLMESASARRAGLRSGQARWARSKKLKFLAWALSINRSSPHLSKNDVAERYARDNPGTSVTTLRRYLSELPAKAPKVQD